MLLAEQERVLTSEQALINSDNLYIANPTVWTTIHDYGNIVVPVGGSLVVFSLDTLIAIGSIAAGYGVAIEVGVLKYVAGWYYDNTTTYTQKHLGAIIWLPAGTYDVKVGGIVPASDCSIEIWNFKCGLVSFNDAVTSSLQHYSVNTDISLTVAARTTPTGPLNQAVYAVNICTNGVLGTSFIVKVDGASNTVMDEYCGTTPGATSINGCHIYKLYVPLAVGSAHVIRVEFTGGKEAYLSVVACPWILTTPMRVQKPLTFDFPQLTTFYANLGSLFANDSRNSDGVPTKNAYLGNAKAVPYGISDYYVSAQSLSGALPFSYNFSSLCAPVAPWIVDGLGGCIENIGVDLP